MTFDWQQVMTQASSIPVHTLGAALALTLASYFCLGNFDRLALRYAGKPVSVARTFFTSFVAYAFSHTVSFAALTGAAVRFRFYSAAGLNAADIAKVVGFCAISSALGLASVAGVSLLLAPAQAATLWHTYRPLALALGGCALIAVGSYVIWSFAGCNAVRIWRWNIAIPRPQIVIPQLLIAVLDVTLAASVLWLLLPGDAGVSLIAFAGIYALACVAGIASHVPGGLGVFESIVILTLPQVAPERLAGSLLAYRSVYYWLPLGFAALCFAGHEFVQQRARLRLLEEAIAAIIAPLAPRLIGLLVFLAGLVLLISGATPAIDARLASLRHILPLPILELSHLAGSVIGLAAVILARALFRRVRAAFQLTCYLLLGGILASLLKGLDFEEAALLATVLAITWAGRRAFYRPSSILNERFTPGWVASLIGVVLLALVAGLIAHRDVAYTSELWWTFAHNSDAPRALRAALAVALIAAAFLAHNLLRPPRISAKEPQAGTLLQAAKALAISGDSGGNAALIGDKQLLFSNDDSAFLMYQTAGASWIALGDPIGNAEWFQELAWRFRELADYQGASAVYYQVSDRYLALYLDLGMTPLKIGEEACVDLSGFSLDGAQRADLRQAHRRALRDGASFEIVAAEGVAKLLPRLRRISDDWLAEKATAEKGFSVGSFRDDYLQRFPIAVVRAEGDIVAFANLWTAGDQRELSVDLMRFGRGAPRGVMDFLLIELMLWGRIHNYHWFNLGVAPLSGLSQRALAPRWYRFANFVYRHGAPFYNFSGLRQYKSKFDPIWRPRYLVAPGGLALPRVVADVSLLIAGGVRELLTQGN